MDIQRTPRVRASGARPETVVLEGQGTPSSASSLCLTHLSLHLDNPLPAAASTEVLSPDI